VPLQHRQLERNVGRKTPASAAPITREAVEILAKLLFTKPLLGKTVRNVRKANCDLSGTNMCRQLGGRMRPNLGLGHLPAT